jgi:Na+-translocating ferredoxin:NAD+ oxidoreductase RnfC subunit
MFDRDSIIRAVKDAGVVGSGGGGFPAHVKIASRADTLIINGAECEPLLCTDRYIAAKYASQIK